ncbi:MAG TPA: calcium:proton antiporter [Candidatus Competibacteraceae bacterium]|nr:calcium:proton antiporter [Candidatus Competibacteraceae bacterium]HQD57537.1 calcium:proton antiporter [Candidatus Competibacteraceae bacterium]
MMPAYLQSAVRHAKSEPPIVIALVVLILGLLLEHSAVEHGGLLLWGLLLVILVAIIGVAFRISHHAEVLALRLGEPYGTLILTIAAVSVEVVILVVLLQGAPNPTLARDTVYAAVMLDINGILGIAALIGGLRHGETPYNVDSASAFIAMLLVAIGIGMFIPDFVPEERWQIYSAFSVGIMALMYLAFLRLQTVEHRQFFEYGAQAEEEAHDQAHSPNALHIGVMIGAIVLVGLLSEVLSVLLDAGLAGSSLPKSIPAVLVALISASPELLTALKAAYHNRMQTTVNIALGASLATVLLTLPVIETIALITGERIVMALTPVQAGMLLLTLLAAMNNLHDGETNAIEGISHLALFATFVALVFVQ